MNNMLYANTLDKQYEAEYQEKGSRFLAYAFPCQNPTQFTQQFASLRITHPKARHHCYAYRFGEHGEEYRVYDDGEPSGTAGLPIYNQLLSFTVSNAAIVVVRYFSGTLLGTSGLIRAYKTAAQLSLTQANLQQIVPKVLFSVRVDYAQVHKVMYLVDIFKLNIIKQQVDMQSEFFLEAERDRSHEIIMAFHQQQLEVIFEEN